MSKKVGRSFWWLWLIANIVGNTLLPCFIWEDPYDLRSRIFLNEILHGVGLSIAQSMVLRDRFAKEGWWLPLTLCGWSMGLAVVFFTPSLSLRAQEQNLSTLSILVIDFAIIGTIVGICQWQLLKSFRAGGLWLFASAIALSLSALGLNLGYMLQSSLLASVLQGAIYGSITGLAAIKVLRSPKLLPKERK
ncbi:MULTISPECIES: hypothetical protein [Pseudanabaena]|uniref:Uncharacterized protein n=2 Tax=Pseudanabaena TaxID=1152 RepID=L8MZQ6_9CYAN|nr:MULTISPECIES: hypothetical protein [Pseudanabaena]ELS31975.1 hypothetical protein Pse7429DRAFT_2757 [Pseudanabaena biceps PCC 7429]MDG3495773.1 hypothetical protein [Pseudanabaena catenata USMAC16]